MKFWSVFVLTIFLNFTVLPSIAAIFSWDLKGTNTVLNEEEPHSNSVALYEKTIPKILDVFDYLKFSEPSKKGQKHLIMDDDFHLSPLLTIFSPPPEI